MDLQSLAGGVLWVDAATDLDVLLGDLGDDWAIVHYAVNEGATKDSIIAAIGEALDFPDWAGRNLDALYELLTDLEWLATATGAPRNVAVVLDRSLPAATNAIEDWDKIVYVLLDAAAWWQPEPRNFLAILR